ncbi:MAG: (4Fe-4S)-binding protein [Flavobacterium sp.]|uniref:(4Fe-4S)-binding protein n=1 Tax=Flavobacterium sp. TaxID=239 RepID=UPI001223D1A9|nr:(4Fe-4S)-binding protein [Flavobacterium sp.]RZJ64340.1 MAG: (4Fe-4S)-binding protein [Flavobacterium sp.]
MDIVKEYSNGEVTIVWKPSLCTHSTNCWRGLPGVFKPREKPWIVPEGASTNEIVGQVAKCPSKALLTYMNSDKPNDHA